MRKLAWSNGHSHQVVPVRHNHDYSFSSLEAQIRSSRAVKAEAQAKRHGRVKVVCNPRRDNSRKYVRQSGGYVTSGWRQG